MQENTTLTAAEARSLAHEAYVFGLPLVYFALNAEVMANVAKPEGNRAPYNQFAHVRQLPDIFSRIGVGWNVDTLYSVATLDLTREPLVLSIPKMGHRWWLMQVVDAWDDVPAALGIRTVGNKGGHFALVGPDWKGALPDGLKEVRIDTGLCGICGRTYTAGKDDYAAVHRLQDRYELTPLSKWGKGYIPPAMVSIKPGVDTRTPVGTQVFQMSPEAFFNRLCELLISNPARKADAPVMARIAGLGITPGTVFRMDVFGDEIRRAIAEGVAAGQKAILDEEPRIGGKVNGWVIALDRGRYGTKYTYRAAWTYFALGVNLPGDAIYRNALEGTEDYSSREATSACFT